LINNLMKSMLISEEKAKNILKIDFI
jgi:hypothetical protein